MNDHLTGAKEQTVQFEPVTTQYVFDAALSLAMWKPQGACTCAGPDGPCENCEANREAYEERHRELQALIETMQTDAYAVGRKDEQDELASVLPGTTYMDPPDGGAPTILEQLQRQAKDARRYCLLRQIAYVGVHPLYRDLPKHQRTLWALRGLFDTHNGNLDAAVDAALERSIREAPRSDEKEA